MTTKKQGTRPVEGSQTAMSEQNPNFLSLDRVIMCQKEQKQLATQAQTKAPSQQSRSPSLSPFEEASHASAETGNMKEDVMGFEGYARRVRSQVVDADFQPRSKIDLAGLLRRKMAEEVGGKRSSAAVVLKKNKAGSWKTAKKDKCQEPEKKRKRIRKRGKSGTDVGGEDLRVSQLKEQRARLVLEGDYSPATSDQVQKLDQEINQLLNEQREKNWRDEKAKLQTKIAKRNREIEQQEL